MHFFRRDSRRVSDAGVGKSKWTNVKQHVRRQSTTRKSLAAFRRVSAPEVDPFLERFTVTGRAITNKEDEFTWSSIFTRKFWKEFVIDPAGVNYYWWSLIMTIAVLYNLVFVILRIVFYHKLHVSDFVPIWMTLDYLSDLIYIFDMFLKSRLGFLDEGIIVKDIKRLGMMFIHSWKFKFGVFCILPFDFLYLVIGFNYSVLRINRCIKLWRVREFFILAETHTNFPHHFRVFKLVLYIIILIHWNACIYFEISRALGFGTDGWVYPDPSSAPYSDFWMQYIYSFYWSVLTLTTIGDTAYPEHVYSYCYCIVDALVGVLMFATIFGNIGAMINEMDASRTEFQRKVDSVKRYMEIRQVAGELQERVVKWFDYTWNNEQSIDDRKALEALPEKLRAEISIHVHLSAFRDVAIFKDCEPGLLVELVLKLRLQVFSPGDYICRKGDIGKEMYIIKRGVLQVVSEDGKKVFATLKSGCVFGEISILNIAGNKTGNRRTASVRSLGYSDIFCLSKNDLWDALQEYPEGKKLLSEKGKDILKKDGIYDAAAAKIEERRRQNVDFKIDLIAEAIDKLQEQVQELIDDSKKKHASDSEDDDVDRSLAATVASAMKLKKSSVNVPSTIAVASKSKVSKE